MLFNQVAFENQSFDFRRGDDCLEVGDVRDHGLDFRAVIFAGLKILAHAIFQHDRFADVNNFSAGVLHEVNARRVRQRLQFFLKNIHAHHTFKGD